MYIGETRVKVYGKTCIIAHSTSASGDCSTTSASSALPAGEYDDLTPRAGDDDGEGLVIGQRSSFFVLMGGLILIGVFFQESKETLQWLRM